MNLIFQIVKIKAVGSSFAIFKIDIKSAHTWLVHNHQKTQKFVCIIIVADSNFMAFTTARTYHIHTMHPTTTHLVSDSLPFVPLIFMYLFYIRISHFERKLHAVNPPSIAAHHQHPRHPELFLVFPHNDIVGNVSLLL